MKFKLRRIDRGENSGKGFFISTFRFDLPLAQALEKIALANGLSMSSVINQVLMNYIETADIPDNIKPVKTAVATSWGKGKSDEESDEKPAKKRRVKHEDEKPAKKVKKARKARKVVEDDEDDEDEAPKKKAKKAAAGVLSKLKKKSVDDEVPEDD